MSKNLYTRNGIYWARFKVKGVEYRESLRTRSEKLAEKRLKARREEIENEAVYGISGPVGWMAAVVSWNVHIGPNLGGKTLKRYKASLGQLRGFLDHLDVQSVSADVLREMIKERRRSGVSNATIRRDLTAISSVLGHACDEGWITENAALSIDRKRLAPEKKVRIVLPREAAIKEMVAWTPDRFGDLMLFARETGLRMDEIINVRHDAVDKVRMTLTVEEGKGDKTRVVTLTRKGLAIINKQPRFLTSPWVFWHGDGEPYAHVSSRFGDFRRRVARKAAQEKREFIPFRFHDLRHLFAVEYLRNLKGTIYDLQRELGHESITTTEDYLAFLSPEQEKAARFGVAQKTAQTRRSRKAKTA